MKQVPKESGLPQKPKQIINEELVVTLHINGPDGQLKGRHIAFSVPPNTLDFAFAAAVKGVFDNFIAEFDGNALVAPALKKFEGQLEVFKKLVKTAHDVVEQKRETAAVAEALKKGPGASSVADPNEAQASAP